MRVNGGTSEWFEAHWGLRQGCPLSIDKVMREAKEFWMFREVKLSTGGVGILLFAVDMVLMSETEDGNLQVLSDVLTRWELKVNCKKTKVMRAARKAEECEIKIADKSLEQVDTMKYLGVFIYSDGSMEKEVEARIGSATRMLGGLSEIVLKREDLSKRTKLKVMNATMIPTLMYGCETWSLSKQQQSRVQAM